MGKEITITWNGHSCYTVEADGYSIVFDPYADGAVPGYGPLRLTANEVICSHEHRDHGYKEAVDIVPGSSSPFTVEFIDIPHDDAGGTLRGMNRIAVVSAFGMRLAHFGDIGCDPSPEQEELLKGLDLVLIPVGGYYTMEPDGILKLLGRIAPKVVVPMHYRTADFGYEVLHLLDDFVSLRNDVIYYDTNTFVLTGKTPAQTAVLKYQTSVE